MLELSTAKVVKDALDKRFSMDAISLACVCKMQPIQSNNNGYTILALQYAELTIMVRIEITASGVRVVEIKTQEW